MLTAIRKRDREKVIGDEIEKNNTETYYCDFCKGEVIHNKSRARIKVGHFKHKKKTSDCSNSEGETLEHELTKYQIYNYIKKEYQNNLIHLEVEKWIANNQLRADVFFQTKKGNRVAIEIQCTSITWDEISRRTELYYENDIYVFWVLPYNEERALPIEEDDERNYDEYIKLKAYEQFLYWSNFKSLYFWDVEGPDTFIKFILSDYSVPQDDYYDHNGEYQTPADRKTKTMKVIEDRIFDLELKDFKVQYFNEFKWKKIPKRKIFIFQ